MNEKQNSVRERAFDVLLSEVHGSGGPRDFTNEIVSHLNSAQAQPSEWIAPAVRVSKTRARSKNSLRWVWMPVVAAIAASLLLVVWYAQPENRRPKIGPAVAGNFEAAPSAPTAVPKPATKPMPKPKTEIAVNDSRSDSTVNDADDWPAHGFEPANIELRESVTSSGIPLAGAGPTNRNGKMSTQPRLAKPVIDSQPVRLVSRHVNEEMRTYWRGMGVKATDNASAELVSRRIAIAIGVQVSKEVLSDIDRLQDQLSNATEARSIATRWLNQVTSDGLGRMDEADRDELISVFSTAITSRKGFDRVIAELISGNSPLSSTWYNALGSRGEAAMHIRLASVSMNTDMRCTRCHDALIEGMGRQEDHWSFVAVVRSKVRMNEEGRFEVLDRDTVQGTQRNFFYDLPDGRRRLVRPAIAGEWMGMEATQSASNLDQWADDLKGSRALANGIVNSLWRTLYGRSLIGSGVDAATSPDQESLLGMQKEFSDDLIASGFDVARTLALMIHSPAFYRSVPDVLQSERSLLARREQLDQANKLVDTYAGASPPRSSMGMGRRVVHVLRAAGASIDMAGGESAMYLGQADDSQTAQVPKNRRTRRQLSTDLPLDFPTEGNAAPVPWLDSVSDFDSKVNHLAYLSGRSRVPDSISMAIEAMRQAKTDDELMLQRTWWLLSK